MLNDIEIAVLTWLLSRGSAIPPKLFVYRTDALGQASGRAEMVALKSDDGVKIHDTDSFGNPVPRPRLAITLNDGVWSLFSVDPLGRPYRIRDLIWRKGKDGLELAEADAIGGAEARPLFLLSTKAGVSSLFAIDDAGGKRRVAQNEVREDKATGFFLLHELSSTGELVRRPTRVLMGRA